MLTATGTNAPKKFPKKYTDLIKKTAAAASKPFSADQFAAVIGYLVDSTKGKAKRSKKAFKAKSTPEAPPPGEAPANPGEISDGQ